MEHKAVDFQLDGELFIISVDPNKDGEKVLEIRVHMKEVPDEVLAVFKKD